MTSVGQPGYLPYCGACSGLIRMQRMEAQFECPSCGLRTRRINGEDMFDRTAPATEASGEVVQGDRITTRAAKCGHHFDAECIGCQGALSWTNQEMDRLRDHRLAHSGVGNVVAHPDLAGHTADAVRDAVRTVCGKIVSFNDSSRIADQIWAHLNALSTTEPVELQTDREKRLEAALKALHHQALQSPDLRATEWGQEAIALAHETLTDRERGA